MKKILLFTALILGWNISGAYAQMHIGIKAGANITTAKFIANYEADIGSVAGLYVGPYVNIDLSDKLLVQPALLYSMEGYQYDHPSLDEDPRFRNNYLTLPVVLRYRAMNEWYLEAGPRIGFLLSSRNKLADVDAKHLFKNMDVGLSLGAGYQFANGLAAEARYHFGLINFDSDDDDEDGSLKSRVFSIGIAYVMGEIPTQK